MSGLFNDDTLSLYLKLKEAMKQYVRDAMPGGALSPEYGKPSSVMENYRHPMGGGKYINTEEPLGPPTVGPLSLDPTDYIGPKTLANIGLMAKAAIGPAMLGGLLATSKNSVPSMMRQSGQIAWHGSPHKFPPVRELLMPDGTKLIQDLTQSTHLPEGAKVIAEHPFGKFDLSKIGSGEGAQAYGHGLYLAESPKVAGGYRDKLAKNEVLLDGGKVKHDFNATDPQSLGLNALTSEPSVEGAARALRDAVADPSLWGRGTAYEADLAKQYSAAADWLEQNAKRLQVDSGHLYKTDIPDEAVARFLDWDKPLSQQAKEVQAAIKQSSIGSRTDLDGLSGNSLHDLLMFDFQDKLAQQTGKARNGSRQNDVSNYLQSQGIPGIRYLDGGSRGAGTGTSNFVVFDPEMIRILERNGVATGAKPWQPGEWEGLFK